MKKILRTELTILKLKQANLVLSMDINDPDGGLDAYIGSEIPESHSWIPAGKSGWQFKAQRDFSVSDATDAVLNDEKSDLKPRVKKLLDEQGTYVLAVGGKDYCAADLEARQEKIIETFRKMGYSGAKAKVFSSGQIADWASTLPSVVAYLKPEREYFKDFSEWEKGIVANEIFIADLGRKKIIADVQQAIVTNQNNSNAMIIRLVGLSGVGKTRLAYESLNVENLKEIVLYVESPDKLPTSRFNVIAQNEQMRVILVVDECSHGKFIELAKEAESIGGRMTLIALDYDIDLPRSPQDKHIILEPLDQTASEELIKATVPTLPVNALKKIAEYSEGFPLILIILAINFNLQPEFLSPETLNNLGINDLLNRIIIGRGESAFDPNEVRKTLTAVSLFKRLGWDAEVSIQGQKVCELHHIDWISARRIIEEQERRKLVAKRGRYRYVTPLPLAINLASTWLSAMDASAIGNHLRDLPDAETRKAFLERLTDLGYTDYAQRVVRSFLASFDFTTLDTSTGSQIFLNLSNIDRMFAMEMLEKILGSVSREEMLEFKAGRRNIIWALEKIAWWRDTFARSARMLLKLADAENEEWSNNATGTFANLFQTFLGGTEVPLWERYLVLEEVASSSNKNVQRIALKAIQATLRLTHATRTVSAEEQGVIIPPPEWNPRSREDIQKSVNSAIGLIDKLIKTSDREIQLEAFFLIISNMRMLLNFGFVNEVLDRLKSVLDKFPELEKELVRTVEMILYYDKNLPSNTIQAVQQFKDSLIGSNYHGLMKRYVGSDLIQDHLNDKMTELEDKIKMLARMSLTSPADLEKELNWLVTNQAENGYRFGKALGEIDTENKWLKKIEDMIRITENPSTQLFGGYLSSLKIQKESLYEETLVSWLKEEKLLTLLPELLWQSGASDVAAKLVIKMLNEEKMDPAKVRLFTYGAWFSPVKLDIFIGFLEELYKIDNGKYASDILGIISYYAERNQALLKIKDLVLKFLAASSFVDDDMTAYFWDKLSRELMEQNSEIIPCIVDLLLRTLSSERLFRFREYLSGELEFALKQDSETTWNKVKDVLIAGDLSSWRLLQIIRGEHGVLTGSGKSLLQLIPEEELWKWVEDNPKRAPYILARMVPLRETEPLFHPIARKLLLKFPDDTDVKEALSGNWHEGSFSGKISEYFRNKLTIAQGWAKDSEPAVSRWAENEVSKLKDIIKSMSEREEEREY